MDRRVALKNLGLSVGYIIAVPTLISIVQSCKNEKAVTWMPEFFSKEEGDILVNLVDIILPKTDSPSASEVNVHMFIDKYINVASTLEEKDLFKLKMSKFIALAKGKVSKEASTPLSVEDLENTLGNCLKLSKEEIEANNVAMENYNKALADGKVTDMDVKIGASVFAIELRNWVIYGYKTTEEIAKNYLAFDPIPGKYIPCGTVEELTGGKAWS